MMTIATQDKRKQLEKKLLDLAFERVELSSASALLLSALIVVALWPSIEHVRLLVWLGVMAVIQALNIFFARGYKSSRNVEAESRKWQTRLIANGVAAGLCWGGTVFSFPAAPFNPEMVSGVFVLPSSPFDPVMVVLMLILAGVAAYASVAMAFVPPLAIAFVACALLPLSIWLFSFGEHVYISISLIILSYFVFMVMLSRRMYATVCNLITVSEENLGLRTEQQQAEQRMARFFENAPGFFYTAHMTQEGKSFWSFASTGIEDLFGVTVEEMKESITPLVSQLCADDIEMFTVARELSRKNLTPLHIEFRINHKLKGERWIELNSMPQREADGATTWHGFMQDITARKQIANHLEDAHVGLQTMMSAIPDMVWLKDTNGVYLSCNSAFERFFGAREAEIIGNTDYDFVDAELADFFRQKDQEAIAARHICVNEENVTYAADGKKGLLETRKVAVRDHDGKVVGVLGVARDVTEMRGLQQRQQEFFAAAPGLFATIELRADGSFAMPFVSDGIREVYGLEPEAVMQDIGVLMTVDHPDDAPMTFRKTLDSARDLTPFHVEFRINHPTKGVRWLEARSMPRRLPDGGTRWNGFFHDITERKRMQDEIAAREREFRTLAENTPDPIYRYDRDCRRIYVNQAVAKITGKPLQSFIGNTPADGAIIAPVQSTRLMESLRTVFASGETHSIMVEFVAQDAEPREYHMLLIPEFDANGQVTTVLAMARDVTEMYRLQQQQAQFFAMAPGLFTTIELRADGSYTMPFVSDGSRELFGLEPEDAMRDVGLMMALAHPEDSEMVYRKTEESARELTPFHVEYRINHPGKGLRWLEVNTMPQRLPDGGTRWDGFFHDITERKQTQQQMQLLDTAISHSNDAIFLIDNKTRFHYVNDAACRNLGYSREELLGMGILDIDPLITQEQILEGLALLAAGGEFPPTMESLHRARDGREFPVELSTSLIEHNGEKFIMSVARDISERKKMEVALQESEAQYRHNSNLLQSIFESPSQMGIYALDREYRYLAFNSRFREGAKRLWNTDIAVGMSMLDSIDSDAHREICRQGFEQVLAGHSFSLETKETVVKDGVTSDEYHENYGAPIRNDNGEIIGLTIFATEITERKRIQEALTERERDFRSLASNLPDNIARWDVQGRYLYVNPVHERTLGVAASELMGKTIFDAHEHVKAAFAQVVASGQAVELVRQTVPVNGELQFHEVTLVPEFDAAGQLVSVLGLGRNMTEYYRMQDAIVARGNLLNAIVESSPDVIVFALDTQYRYLSFNRKHKETMQAIWGKEIVVGGNMLEVIGDHPDRKSAQGGMDRALAGESFVLEEAYGDELLARQYWLNYWAPIRSDAGEVIGLTCFVMNVSDRKRIEEAMRANEEKLSSLFELSPLGIALTDAQGRYVEFNEAFRAISGYPEDELKALDYWTLTPKKYEAQEAKQLESLVKTGRYGPYEKEYQQKNGKFIPIQLNGVRVTGTDGQQYIWSIVEDIRERKKSEVELQERFRRITELNQNLERNAHELEEQAVELEMSKQQLQQTETWYRSIMHSAPDGMLIVDSRGIIMQVNAQLETMFGYYGGELPGTSIEALVPDTARAGHVAKRNGFIAGGNKEHRMAGAAKDLFGRRKDGSLFPVDVSLSRLPDLDGRVGAICAAVRDVTERQKSDAARESALSEALRLAQLRSSFLAQMSHELRTPLNGILGYTQNLLRGEALVESQRSGLNIIQHSGEHLLTLINGILDHAAIEAGKFELIQGDIELESFLSTLIGIIRVRAEQKSVAFSCEVGDDLPAMVSGDAQRLRQVLLNLLSNAVKFTDNGQVILRITYSASSRMRFEVQDSGVGIAADQLDNIFLPFEQVGETSRRAGGNGLGLAISRKLVELMGGNIKVESQLGAGSVFSFEIEMVAVQSATAKVNASALSQRATTRGSPLASTLMAPPPQELDALHALALRGNMRDIALQATRLIELDPLYMPFAEHLRQLAKGFQTKALLGFIAQYRNTKELK